MNATYGISNIGMAAFSVFLMQSPSFLAHQRQLEEGHGRSNCASLFGIAKIPSGQPHPRHARSKAEPVLLRPVFAETIEQLKQIDGGLDMFRRLDGRVLIALDGSITVRGRSIAGTARRGSEAMAGRSISTACWRPYAGGTRARQGDPTGAGIHRPARWGGRSRIARTWRPSGGWPPTPRATAALDPVYLGDDLFFSPTALPGGALDSGGHLIFVCKPSSHPLIPGIPDRRRSAGAGAGRSSRGQAALLHRYRWLHDVPLRDGRDALIVNWFGDRDHQHSRRDHLPQQLRHRSAGRSRYRRRTCRLWPGQVEDRERDLQRSE